LQRGLADKGIRIQAVLPGATATDLWALAGLPHQSLPPEIVMSPEDMVDAALVGLDHGELVTIPSWLPYPRPPRRPASRWSRSPAATASRFSRTLA
jgi:uncharacterized protein